MLTYGLARTDSLCHHHKGDIIEIVCVCVCVCVNCAKVCLKIWIDLIRFQNSYILALTSRRTMGIGSGQGSRPPKDGPEHIPHDLAATILLYTKSCAFSAHLRWFFPATYQKLVRIWRIAIQQNECVNNCLCVWTKSCVLECTDLLLSPIRDVVITIQ